MKLVELRRVTASYGGRDAVPVLQDINLSIEREERTALLGANGAGKSSLLLSMVGILPLVSGEIVINSLPLKKENLAALRKSVGLVFQNPDDQLFMPTVFEDVAFGLRNYGETEEEEKVKAVLEKLGIASLARRSSRLLSGGEKRLAALAGVLVMEPQIILMDEPGSFLDPRARRNLVKILQEYAREISPALLIATHDFDLARKICSRAVLLKEGRIFAEGPIETILADASLLEECGL
ncbi:MAG: energy-coupling factor ABC transporter ATP-binding protein [Treponema sp.]|nr:energy-coupling factor ABC transporter ATP-binding protein [Treponema sp.]